MTETAVIITGARTPIGKFFGGLKSFTAAELGAMAIKAAVSKAKIDPKIVDYVIMGQVLTAGAGQLPARQAAIKAGLDWSIPAITINKVCLSGIDAIFLASNLIRSGVYDTIIAGGQESMTNAPHLLPGFRGGHKYGSSKVLDHIDFDGLRDVYTDQPMGSLTDYHNKQFNFSRSEQDDFSAQSHQKAIKAWENNIFADEVIPVSITDRKKGEIVVRQDESFRVDTTIEKLSQLKPSFSPDGDITAGNASPISDGACALVVMSKTKAQDLGLEWLVEIGPGATVAGPDSSLQLQPANAIKAVSNQLSIAPTDFDLYEINEAFAQVALASIKDLALDRNKVNVNGGAIALGHPLGMSGARLVLHLALELKRNNKKYAVASLCGGGGQGEALSLINTA